MELKSFMLKLFQLNIPGLMFMFNSLWIKIGGKNVTEIKEERINDTPQRRKLNDLEAATGNDDKTGDLKGGKPNAIGNSILNGERDTDILANGFRDNAKNIKDKNAARYSEFPGKADVKPDVMAVQRDKTTKGTGFVDIIDIRTVHNKYETEERESIGMLDDKMKSEIMSSPIGNTDKLDSHLDKHHNKDSKINSETKFGASNKDNRSESTADTCDVESAASSLYTRSEMSGDREDGFLKYLKMCTGGRAKTFDQDDETYGFDEKAQNGSSRGSRRRRPSFRRSYGRVSPTPFGVHYKEVKNKPFDFQTSPKQDNNDKIVDSRTEPKEFSAQQETGICSEIVDDDQYTFSYPQRGYMVLIVNDRFLRQSPRDGANWDLQKAKQIATKFGFRIFNTNQCRNLTQKETFSILRSAQNHDHSDSDCFMFVVSTHGLEMANPRAKGKLDHVIVCSDDQFIFTSDILDMFSDRNCPTLKNKPKMFFIQACRGEKFDSGSNVLVIKKKGNEDRTDVAGGANKDRFGRVKPPSVDVTDTKPSGDSWAAGSYGSTATSQLNDPISLSGGATGHAQYSVGVSDQSMVYSRTYTAESARSSNIGADDQRYFETSQLLWENHGRTLQRPCSINETQSLQFDNDFLVMYAIPPGYFAWRNTADGSWMIDYLHQTVMAYDMKKPQNFLKLLNKVTWRMSRRQTNTPSDPRMDQMKAVSVIEHKLVKDIIFKPKAVQSTWIRGDTSFLI